MLPSTEGKGVHNYSFTDFACPYNHTEKYTLSSHIINPYMTIKH